MSRKDEFFHGTDKDSAHNIMAIGFQGMGDGDFGRGDYFTAKADWAGDYAGFPENKSGRIVKATIEPQNPLVHEHGDTPKDFIKKAVKKSREMWPEDDEMVKKLKEGHEHAIAEMSGRLGYDAYVQPSGLLVTKQEGIAHPTGTLNFRQFEEHIRKNR